MKTRTALTLLFLLLIIALSGILFFYSPSTREALPVFDATVNRDCAPWDGAAFTVSIPHDSVSVITISIWKSPDFKFPTAFSLPDEAGQVGYAYILSELGPLIPMNGEVSFQRVEEGMPVEGRFSFTSERGEVFEGKFVAEWAGQITLCG